MTFASGMASSMSRSHHTTFRAPAATATATAKRLWRPMTISPPMTTTTTALAETARRPLWDSRAAEASLLRRRRRRRSHLPRIAPLASTASNNGDGSGDRDRDRDIERILRSLDGTPSSSPKPLAPSPLSPSPSPRPPPPSSSSSPSSSSDKNNNNSNFFLGPPQGRGTYLLVLLNIAVFAVATLAGTQFGGGFGSGFGKLPSLISSLALHHSRPRWWQLVTCSFLHLDLSHLAGNLFSLLVFGRDIELSEGSAASVWVYYVITAFCASLASLVFAPKGAVSMGASGAVFGLFAVAVAGKVSLNLRSIVECGVLASFVVPQVLREAKMQALGGTVTGGGAMVGHVAHLGGAAAGVLVVLLLSRLPQA